LGRISDWTVNTYSLSRCSLSSAAATRPVLNVSAVMAKGSADIAPVSDLGCPSVKLPTVLFRMVEPGTTIRTLRTPESARYSISPAAR
jgi:hypothetical protein